MFSSHQPSQTAFSPLSKQREEKACFGLLFWFRSHREKLFTAFPPWHIIIISLDGPREDGAAGARLQMEERTRPGGSSLWKRTREETSYSKMSLFVPKWLVHQPELQRFCATGSYMLRFSNRESIRALIIWKTLRETLGRALWRLQKSLLLPAVLNAALICYSKHLWVLTSRG